MVVAPRARLRRWFVVVGASLALAVVGGAAPAHAFCGDGIVEAGEECDDGNANNRDDCIIDSGAEVFCRLPTCGDAFVHDQGTGTEQCDDANGVDLDCCRNDCQRPRCGDGLITTLCPGVTEQCDDGNAANTDACVGACVPAACGDGFVQTGVEECDDGNNGDETDACVHDTMTERGCIAARCGDGLIHAGVEQCDDGNADDDDACTSVCGPPACGDGILHAQLGEVCDDGAGNGADPFVGCATDCTPVGVVARSGACATGGGGVGLAIALALAVVALGGRRGRRRRRGPWPTAALALVAAAAAPTRARADADGFRLSRFAPAPSLDDGLGLILPATLDDRRYSAMLTLDFAASPFVLRSTGTMTPVERDIISNALLGHLDLALGLGDRYQLALELPLVLTQDATPGMIGTAPYAAGRTALADGRFGGAVRLLGRRGPGFALGAAADLLIPMGSADDFAGDGRVGVHGRVLAAYTWPRLAIAIDTGVEARPDHRFADVRFGPELLTHLGVQVPIDRKLTALAELASAVPLTGQDDGVPMPFELLAGARYKVGPWVAGLGAGVGLTDAVGVPSWRALLSFGRSNQPDAAPVVRHAVVPTRDDCPTEDEDVDGFADQDGCPDPDDDQDGILDADDGCRRDAEDIDGVADADGCPETDADRDGIVDTDDRCPLEPESKNGQDDGDGCPDVLPQITLQGILKQMADRILFDFDKAELDAADRAVLAEVAALLATTPEIELLSIEGHASSEGSDAYNDDLSRRRAQAAIDGLIAAGVAPARLKSAHFGEAKPFVANTTEDRRRQNRRVELHIERFKGPTQ